MIKIKYLLLITLLLLCVADLTVGQGPRNIQKEKVVYALNCGSNSGFMSEHGFEYRPVV